MKGLEAVSQTIKETIRHQTWLLLKIAPLIAFSIPLLWLYLLEPLTFELMWKGRTFELFFIWLISLELILSWEDLRENKIRKLISPRTAVFGTTLALPALYVAASHYLGLNEAIFTWSTQNGITWANNMSLSTEYLVFTATFLAIILLSFGLKGLKIFAVPTFFLLLVGAIYMIDNIYPYGQFAPFQVFVPTTTALATAILNIMGYTTNLSYEQSNIQGKMPVLTTINPATSASATFSIAWPCAGIESFLIFTVVLLLFLKRMPISLKGKIGYFSLGAAVTYVINALRIVNIFSAGMVYGENSVQVQDIHFYYGPLYAVAWIISYPLLILGSQRLWHRSRKPKQPAIESQLLSLDPA
jgi:thaumarchaeosortase